jgi:phospholipase/carboxylesterase
VHGVERKNLVIGGFSQGAMLATEVALFSPEPFAGLVVMSGSLLSEDRWRPRAKEVGPAIHALVSHGRADPIVPYEGGEGLKDLLTETGADVQWIAHRGQHEIPGQVLDAFAAFAKKRLA